MLNSSIVFGVALVCFIGGFVCKSLLIDDSQTVQEKPTFERMERMSNSTLKINEYVGRVSDQTKDKAQVSVALPQPLQVIHDFDENLLRDAIDSKQDSILKVAFSEICYKDSYEAARILTIMSRDGKRLELIGEMLIIWGAHDPLAAYKWLEVKKYAKGEFGLDSQRLELIVSIASKYPDYAESRINLFTDINDQNRVYREIARAKVRMNPAESLDWLQSLASKDTPLASLDVSYKAVMMDFMKSDLAKVADAVKALEPSEIKAQLVPEIVFNYAKNDIESGLAWIESLESNDLKTIAYDGMISAAAGDEPELVLDRILSDPDAVNRHLLNAVFRYAGSMDSSVVAHQFSRVPKGLQAGVSATITQAMLDRDAHQAVKWIEGLSGGDSFDNAARTAADFFAYTDQDVAFMWASQIQSIDKRRSALSNLVNQVPDYQLTNFTEKLDRTLFSDADFAAMQTIVDRRLQNQEMALVLP